ncbi:MAG: HD domain-containing protein, partial [Tepidisphaeraceae bacterium]
MTARHQPTFTAGRRNAAIAAGGKDLTVVSPSVVAPLINGSYKYEDSGKPKNTDNYSLDSCSVGVRIAELRTFREDCMDATRVRDPIHNFIILEEEEVKLLKTRALQRLRGIRQLALASLVYPGALHTRFDHTLGVTHVAGLMASTLGFADSEVRLVRLAALLHDIGHGPFSHVSENALDRYGDRKRLEPDQKKETIHELVTARLIQTDDQIQRIIGEDMSQRVAKLLGPGEGQPALKSIVSGPLDADKQDYLLRDSLFCGVQYGVFDIDQLHRSLTVYGPKDEKELMIEPDGLHAVEQFVLAKYYLTTNVYRHRVRLITDQMIVRAIMLGIEEDKIKSLRRLYEFDNSAHFVANYLKWDDARFMREFANHERKRTLCGEMLEKLESRCLLKQVFSNPIRDFPASAKETLLNIGKKSNDQVRGKIEK